MARLFLAFLAALIAISPVMAHEYWLQPSSYRVQTGETFTVDHRNGMRFKGSALPYVSVWNIRSEAWQNGSKAEARGRDGDRPALTMKSTQPGLVILVHEGRPDSLVFTDWEKFKSYLADEGLEALAQEHIDAGLPKDRFKEVYTRFAKALLNVGEPSGRDQPTGLTFELVAQENPALLKPGEPMPVQLLLRGEPVANAPIKVFAGYDTDARPFARTDANGIALIPDYGAGPYLLNSVHLFRPEDAKEGPRKDAQWESYWASLVFSR